MRWVEKTATGIESRSFSTIVSSSLVIAALMLNGCRSEPPARPTSEPSQAVSSCLEGFDVDTIDASLQNCNRAISNSPDQPALLRDRSLLFTLAGRMQSACRDVNQALALLEASKEDVDPMLRQELQVRQATCKQSRTMAGRD